MVLGYFLIDVEPGRDYETYELLSQQKPVLEHYMTFGAHDLIAKVESPNEFELGALASRMKNTLSLKGVQVLTVTA